MKGIIGLTTGFLGGLLGGLLGLGGGVIMIPLMTWLAKATQHQAHGTSLVAIAFVASIGAGTYFIHGNADWKVALLVAVSAIFTARIGARFAHSLPERKLKRAFGVFLIFVSTMLIVKGYLPGTGYELPSWAGLPVFLFIGAFTGFLSGMMGVGGGAVMVPAMVILGNMSQHLAQGTSLLAMIPVSLAGAFTHYRLGNVLINLAAGLAIGSATGGYFGATIAGVLPALYLQVLFACLGLWMGIRYIRT